MSDDAGSAEAEARRRLAAHKRDDITDTAVQRMGRKLKAANQRIAELTKAAQAVWNHVDNVYEPPDDPELYVLAKKLGEIASE